MICARKLVNAGYHQYFKFLDTFGTHFITFVGFGAKFIKIYTMSGAAFEEMNQKGIPLKFW